MLHPSIPLIMFSKSVISVLNALFQMKLAKPLWQQMHFVMVPDSTATASPEVSKTQDS